MRLNTTAEEAAAHLLEWSGASPPVDVWSLAELLGARVVEREMLGDGRLIEWKGHMEIHISTRSRPARRRFTIGHELGHLWMQRNGIDGKPPSQFEEERFCNHFAAALLIPRDWLERSVEDEVEGISQLTRMARRAQTSLSAMLIRLRDVAGWRSTLLRYRRRAQDWHLASCTAGQVSLFERLSSARETTVALTAAAERHGMFHAFLPISIDEQVVSCWAELLVKQHTAIALARFRYEGERLPRGWDALHTTTIPSVQTLCPHCQADDLTWRLWGLTRGAFGLGSDGERLAATGHRCQR